MAARIVRIVGPSYCGSTALGCAMNTGAGVFFGSEIYRYRASWRRDRNGGAFTNCDFCGANCDYWSPALREELGRRELDSLPDIYDALLRRHPDIWMLVDGSKSLPDPDEQPDLVITPRKHPIRLIASRVYNRRRRLGIEADELEVVGRHLERSPELETIVNRSVSYFYREYEAAIESCPDAIVFRADEAHHDGFAEFRRLECALAVPDGTFDPSKFSEHAAHTIGGNRQPIWMTRRASGRQAPSNPRSEYYESSGGLGDWKIDDKYVALFRPATLDLIRATDKYRALCDLLEFDPDAIDPTIGADLRRAEP